MRPNIKFASLDALAAFRLAQALQTHPSPRVNLGGVILASYVIFLILFTGWMLTGPQIPEKDWTDSGVGCIDDCLEPAEIQDEADYLDTERGQP